MDLWVLVVGLLMLAVALPVAGRRVVFLYRLITSGQPAPDRVQNVTRRVGEAVRGQVVEVFGQRKLLKWTVPGAAHFFVFWAFVILASVYLEAFGILFSRNARWAIPVIGHWDLLGFAQDFIAVMALLGIGVFALIRIRENPEKLGRRSRFSGSHLGGAWVILGMIFNVIWTMFLFRGASVAAGNFPYGKWAFGSHAVGSLLGGLSDGATQNLEGVGLLLHIGVMLAFLIIVVNSKHLHIFLAPLNVLFGRRPVALGAARPLTSSGVPVTLDDVEDLDEDARLGIGSISDFSWKGMLDFTTCTECGRCQSQCPAWNTEKPLSPKMLILNLRDHAFAAAPYLLADESARDALPESVKVEAARPLVGETEGPAWEPTGGAVIDTDVLWSCVTCGACVEQCPVDIEHVDHIVDMRRYQVLVESSFPAELNGLFKGLESKGNPWNMSASARLDWTKGLDVDVKVVGEDIESLDEVEWLFWVGCAGAYEDRAKKTARAVAELLAMAGVSFAVLGNGETCTGDSARRAGNEFVFQGLAQQNVETFKEHKATKVVATCAHCFNTLKNEYRQFGIELDVVHHTQLLNRLVREGRLTPLSSGDGSHQRSITYHDPCYIGRHNGVYSPPRELLGALPGATYVEMERNSERSFCCGAGGARMWMEEKIGSRINVNRTTEAVGTGADQIAVACPFCRVMLSDGLTAAQDSGDAREEVEVLDVAQMLLASVKGEVATRVRPGASAAVAAAVAADARSAGPAASTTDGRAASRQASDVETSEAQTPTRSEETRAEPEPGDDTQTEDTVTATEDVGPAAEASGGSSLFDVDESADEVDEPATASPDRSVAEEAAEAQPASSGGSLFDVGADDEAEDQAGDQADDQADQEPKDAGDDRTEKAEPGPASDAEPASAGTPDLGAGRSLFDIEPDDTADVDESSEPDTAPAAEDETDPAAVETTEEGEDPGEPEPPASADVGSARSLFDIEPDDRPAEPAGDDKDPDDAVAEESEVTAAPSASAAPAAPGIGSSGSLFDIAAPDRGPSSAPSEPAAPATAAADTSGSPDPDETDDQPAADADPDAQADDGPADQVDDADDRDYDATPAPTSSGETNQPRTDADIDGTGSLFDL